jgi:hypothetical protein
MRALIGHRSLRSLLTSPRRLRGVLATGGR